MEEKTYPNGLTGRLEYDTDAGSPAEWDQLGTVYAEGSRLLDGWEHIPSTRELAVCLRACRMAGLHALPVRFSRYAPGLTVVDEGQANGYIVATAENVAKNGTPEESIDEVLRGEVAEWNQWLEGEVYGYELTSPEGVFIDSCWGFYGREYAMEEMDSAAGAYTAEEVRERDLEDLKSQREALDAKIATLEEGER